MCEVVRIMIFSPICSTLILYINMISLLIYKALNAYWMSLKVNRLLACKQRRILLTYRMKCYFPSSYTASVANIKYPFLGHSNGEDTGWIPFSVLWTEWLSLWCASSLREVAVNSHLESLKDIELLHD